MFERQNLLSEQQISIQGVMDFKESRPLPEIKVGIVGESGVGKSSILLRYINDEFLLNSCVTCGIDYVSLSCFAEEKSGLMQGKNFQHFYCTHASHFRWILEDMKGFGQSIHAIIQTYREFCWSTMQGMKKVFDRWIFGSKKLRGKAENMFRNCPPNIKKIMIANKSDLIEDRKVSYDEGYYYAKSKGIKFIEVSSKSGSNIHLAFDDLLEKITRDRQLMKQTMPMGSRLSVDASFISHERTISNLTQQTVQLYQQQNRKPQATFQMEKKMKKKEKEVYVKKGPQPCLCQLI